MDKNLNHKIKSKNPEDYINKTYDVYKYNAPQRSSTAFVMPLDMKRDLDYIDPERFYNSNLSEDEEKIYNSNHNLEKDKK